jgi:alpha-ribazole phosphatase
VAHLLIIRHGETLWNKEKRFQGSTDIPLSDKGRAQARRVAEFLADKPLDAIYSSPLQRALVTANTVAEGHGLEVRLVNDLQEINVGEWSGKTWPEIRRIWPELERRWSEDPYSSDPPPGGEVYRDFQNRCIRALDEIAGAHEDSEQVAVVCHGGVIRAVMNELLGLAWTTRGKIYSQNCSVTRMRWKSGGTVIIDGFNDSCHLVVAED